MLNGEETSSSPHPPPSRKVTCHQRECSTQHVTTAPVLGDLLYSNDPHLSYVPGVGVQRGQYLHASHVSFYVSPTSRYPFTPSPRNPSFPHYFPPPSTFHGSRSRPPSTPPPAIVILHCQLYIPSFTHHTQKKHLHFRVQSYRKTKRGKRFRVGVSAPLPPYFVQACEKLKIPLTDELIDGGVRIDDVPQDLSFLRKGEGTDNDMRWLL